jgi:hypothetical protein
MANKCTPGRGPHLDRLPSNRPSPPVRRVTDALGRRSP